MTDFAVPVVLNGELIDGAGRPAEFYGLARGDRIEAADRPRRFAVFPCSQWTAGRWSTARMTNGEPPLLTNGDPLQHLAAIADDSTSRRRSPDAASTSC